MWRLLRKHISTGQMSGFSVANLVGLTIVILGIQFYQDVRPIFEDEESFIKKDYLIVTKRISGLGAIMGANSAFSDEEIKDMESQSWVRKVGRFSTSDYNIFASVALGNSDRALKSYFFFESIPSEFIDVNSRDWEFDPANPVVPVIVSKDYLSLYNFGFAAAQGMPKISEGMIGMIPLTFNFTGNGYNDTVKGRIVGFSNRLNTIIVPEDFMKWSNERYASVHTQSPSRLIVEVNNPGDLKIKEYMNSNNYEIAGDKLESGKANYFLTIIVGIVIAVGVLISLLSFFVLMLSIYLLLQKNSRKLQDLLMLGYSPGEVALPYIKMVACINTAVLLLSVACMIFIRSYYMPMISAFGIGGANISVSVLSAFVIMSVITAGNIFAIRRKVKSLWRQHD